MLASLSLACAAWQYPCAPMSEGNLHSPDVPHAPQPPNTPHPSFELSFDPARADPSFIHETVRATYWSPGIRRDVVDMALRHSIVCTAWADDRMVGIARVVTDRATIAYLCDIWVHPSARGMGIGTALVRACEAHPDLQTVRRWLLATRDAQGLYARLGYGPVDGQRWMERRMPAERWQDLATGASDAANATDAAIAPAPAPAPAATAAGLVPVANEHGQPIGPSLGDWRPPPLPLAHASSSLRSLRGAFVSLVPLSPPAHATALFDALASDGNQARWTYLPYGPFAGRPAFDAWLEACSAERDPMRLCVLDAHGAPVGLTSFMRINSAMGTIELGHLLFGPRLARTPGATETTHLMLAHAFELGYRRVEWKCDSLHAASRRAAERLGFQFEGVHRRAVAYKNRSRDTAWYSMLASEWPAASARHRAWLSASNFDNQGMQRTRLGDCETPATGTSPMP